ncbi:MAG: polymer-forming cytoskeletal protein [Chloroflexota bacterium]
MSFFGNRRQAEQSAPTPLSQKPQLLSTQQPVGFETVLGTNSTLEGHLSSSANVRLDGTFTGTLEIGGNVLVGETAQINADINARNISIAGAVRGNIKGKKVQLLRTGRIWGDIQATALTTEEGAFIDGKITMISPQEETPQEPVVEDTASHMGAVEEEATEKPSDDAAAMTENISEDEQADLPVGGDFNEGQTQADYKDTPDDTDPPKQST